MALTVRDVGRSSVAARSQDSGLRIAAVELRVLGELHACEGSRRIAFRPVERRLLEALAVRHPDPVRYDALADAVWGAAAPRSAIRSLQTHALRAEAR